MNNKDCQKSGQCQYAARFAAPTISVAKLMEYDALSESVKCQ